MGTRACLILVFGVAMGCGSSEEVFVGDLTAPVVYGTDDRVEVFNHPDTDLRRIAEESIVALVPAFRISKESDGTYALSGCPDELFGNQPTAAACSGVLIDDDLVLTAGHCIGSHTPCDAYGYVFNYHLEDPTRLGRDQTPDFAIIQLTRPVEGVHAPASIRPATPLREQESLAMIGFGSGLPAKIDSGGAVADPRAEQLDFFIANVDAFQGHSGSATFDSENRLAGILVAGRTPDYVTLDGETCQRVSQRRSDRGRPV
jgi:S1-C subfamily serine protease